MSTVKNPKEKKQLSLELDCRNTYGENSKSSRKAIPNGKQRRHMDERRSTGEVLLRLKGSIPEDEASDAELLVKTRITVSKRKGFKKQPDAPLGIVLAATKSGRLKSSAHRPL
jgi:transketolase